MAVTRLWPIETNLSYVIGYDMNPKKTDSALRTVIDYVVNGEKTEQSFYVTSINCESNPSAAFGDMMRTKKINGKTGGVLGYHGYMSFEEVDIAPELAHKIGVEFAKEVWGERFEVIVSTHLDRKHLHNHFLLNSISFVDGKRAHGKETSWFKFSPIADRLCKKYGLSVPKKKERNNPAQWQQQENSAGKPTPWNLARIALDEAISKSTTMPELGKALREMGYSFDFNPRHMYWTIVPKGRKKSVRLYRLGEQYTPAAIQQRLLENRMQLLQRGRPLSASTETQRPKQYKRCRTPIAVVRRRRRRHRGLAGLYLAYMYRLGRLPKKRRTSPARVPWQIRDALMQLDEISAQTELLVYNHIETKADMEAYLHGVSEKMTELTAERAELKNKVRRVGITEEGKAETKEKIAAITAQLKELRRDVKLCEGIAERSGIISEQLEELRQKEQQQQKQKPQTKKEEQNYHER